MDGPPVNHRPVERVRPLLVVPVDGVQTGACGRARVLGVLGEGHCTLHPITARGRKGLMQLRHESERKRKGGGS